MVSTMRVIIPRIEECHLIRPSSHFFYISLQDSTLNKFSGSLLNSLTVLGTILLVTAIFVIFYYMAWWRALRKFLIAILIILLLPWIYFSLQMASYYSIPMDYISFILFHLQFVGCGYVGLVLFAESAHLLNRVYLILISLSVAWPFMEFTEWTVWTTIIVLTIYGKIMGDDHARDFQQKSYFELSLLLEFSPFVHNPVPFPFQISSLFFVPAVHYAGSCIKKYQRSINSN